MALGLSAAIASVVVPILAIVYLFTWNQSSTSQVQLNRLSTKTAYRHQGYRSYLDTGLVELSQCQVMHISALYRHGSRCPSESYITKADAIHKKLLRSESGRDKLPPSLIEWTNSFNMSEAKHLTDVGREEMFHLGRRMSAKFGPRLVGTHRSFTQSNTRFLSSNVSRSLESARSFLKGFFADSPEDVDPQISLSDWILRFYDFCPLFKHTVEDNKTATKEYHSFRNGKEMREVAQRITDRFNLSDVDGVTTDDVKNIFTLCGLEVANNISNTSNSSPWCQLMSHEDAMVLEYMLDLKHYWRKAYGYKINYLQGCPFMSHLVETMREVVESDQGRSKLPRGNFMFGHAETVIPVLAMLGLFNQSEVPLADNFDKVSNLPNHERTFLTSKIAPFGANVALVVYSCPRSDASKPPSIRVQPLVNEHSVSWPLCGGRTHCSYQEFINHVSHCHKDTFSLEETCSLGSKSSSDSDISSHDEL